MRFHSIQINPESKLQASHNFLPMRKKYRLKQFQEVILHVKSVFFPLPCPLCLKAALPGFPQFAHNRSTTEFAKTAVAVIT